GWYEANRSASTAAWSSAFTTGSSIQRTLDDDLAEELPLLRARLLEADQLQDSEQRDHDFGTSRRASEQRREEHVPGVVEDAQDLGHAREQRGRLGLDVPGRLAAGQ